VALAGPAVNVVIAILLYPFVAYGGDLSEASLTNVATIEGFLFSLFWVNIFLVIFNALPAFPMDGGRVLRALLAMKLGRTRATSIASGLGQVMAVGFVLFGLVNGTPSLVLIGVFVFFGAQSENVVVQQLDLLKDYTVRSAMMTNFVTLSPMDTVKDAADKLLSGSDQDLIVVDSDRAVGVMTRNRIIEALRENRLSTPVTEVMAMEFDTIEVNDRLTEVYPHVQRKPNSSFPVLENNKLMGVIDMTNINEFVMIRSALRY
jgi:CBS domain-containing protein